MHPPLGTLALCLLLSLSRGAAGSPGPPAPQDHRQILRVPNGGKLGDWGPEQFCPEGTFANGFSLKADSQHVRDRTGLNAIRLHCSDGTTITSTEAPHGAWGRSWLCPSGHLTAFALQAQPAGHTDKMAATNLRFECSSGKTLGGDGPKEGDFGPWSGPCQLGGGIRGLRTKVQDPSTAQDETSLNDVQFHC